MDPQTMFAAVPRIGQDEKRKKKRLVVSIIGLLLTAIGLITALIFGSVNYRFRRAVLHERRLVGLLEEEPTIHQITEGLREKAPLLASPEGKDEVGHLVTRWVAKRDEILEKSSKWSSTRVFDAGDMIYFIYFDAQGIMRDFTYFDNPEFRVQ